VELIAFFRELRARRWLVAAGFAVAVAVGVLLVYRVSLGFPPKFRTRQYYVGEASAQVLIDTPKSQIADLNPPGALVLYTRATLLADLIATAPVQQQIAGQIGVPAANLRITPPAGSVVAPVKASPLGVAGAKAASASAAASPWQLTVTIDPTLPIIAFAAQGPSAAGALSLATAAVDVLRQRVNSLAAGQRVPTNDQAVVNQIGPPVAGVAARGPRKLYGVAATVVVFMLICFVLVGARGFGRRRTAAEPWRGTVAGLAGLAARPGIGAPRSVSIDLKASDPGLPRFSLRPSRRRALNAVPVPVARKASVELAGAADRAPVNGGHLENGQVNGAGHASDNAQRLLDELIDTMGTADEVSERQS
jgi:hypothetical protein